MKQFHIFLLSFFIAAWWSCAPTTKLVLPDDVDSSYRNAEYEINYKKKVWFKKVFEYRVLRDTLLTRNTKTDHETYGIIIPKSSYTVFSNEREQLFGTDSQQVGLRVWLVHVIHEQGHHSLLGDLLFPPKNNDYTHSSTVSDYVWILFKGAMQLPGITDSAVFFFERKKVMAHDDTARLHGYIRMASDSFYLEPFYSQEQLVKNAAPYDVLQGFKLMKEGRMYAYHQSYTGFGQPSTLYLYLKATPQEQLVLAAYCLLLCMEYRN